MRDVLKINDVFLSKFDKDIYKETYDIISNKLINNKELGFDYDTIVSSNSKLKSSDSIIVKDNKVIFIEFKQGFKDKIGINTFTKDQFKKCKLGKDCVELQEAIEDGYNAFFKKRELEKYELIYDLSLKIYESIMFFYKYVILDSGQKRQDIEIIYLFVVDSKYLINRAYSIQGLKSSNLVGYNENVLINKLLYKYTQIDNIDNGKLCDKIFVVEPTKFEELLKSNFDDIDSCG